MVSRTPAGWKADLPPRQSGTGHPGIRAMKALLLFVMVNASIAARASQEPAARALLDAAQAKIRSIPALVVEFEGGTAPDQDFDREAEIFLEKPNRFRIETIHGAAVEERKAAVVSDGQTVTHLDAGN